MVKRLGPIRSIPRVELLRNVTVVVCCRHRSNDGRVVPLLSLVQLIAARISGLMKVADGKWDARRHNNHRRTARCSRYSAFVLLSSNSTGWRIEWVCSEGNGQEGATVQRTG